VEVISRRFPQHGQTIELCEGLFAISVHIRGIYFGD
jgi:hypothetical protein